tara:strand:+ start:2431 stop:2982 length:552 start_codon:yes stop_codon:yes gene_type:complete
MSVQDYAERLRNTRTYTFTNNCGGSNGGNFEELGNFDCAIPPNPFPQDVIATRAIFKLKSFYITEQTTSSRASGNNDEDDSGYFIEISGAGFNQGLKSQAKNCELSNSFVVYNKDAGANNTKSFIYQRISGGDYNGEDVLCSNPYGTILNVKVRVIDGDGTIITDNEFLSSFITFSIELIPDN